MRSFMYLRARRGAPGAGESAQVGRGCGARGAAAAPPPPLRAPAPRLRHERSVLRPPRHLRKAAGAQGAHIIHDASGDTSATAGCRTRLATSGSASSHAGLGTMKKLIAAWFSRKKRRRSRSTSGKCSLFSSLSMKSALAIRKCQDVAVAGSMKSGAVNALSRVCGTAATRAGRRADTAGAGRRAGHAADAAAPRRGAERTATQGATPAGASACIIAAEPAIRGAKMFGPDRHILAAQASRPSASNLRLPPRRTKTALLRQRAAGGSRLNPSAPPETRAPVLLAEARLPAPLIALPGSNFILRQALCAAVTR